MTRCSNLTHLTTGTIQLLFSDLSDVWLSDNLVLSAVPTQHASLWWMSPHSWNKFMGHCRSPGALCSVENQRTSVSGTVNPPAFISLKCILNQCQAGCKIYVANFIVTPAVPQSCEYLCQLHMLKHKKWTKTMILCYVWEKMKMQNQNYGIKNNNSNQCHGGKKPSGYIIMEIKKICTCRKKFMLLYIPKWKLLHFSVFPGEC